MQKETKQWVYFVCIAIPKIQGFVEHVTKQQVLLISLYQIVTPE